MSKRPVNKKFRDDIYSEYSAKFKRIYGVTSVVRESNKKMRVSFRYKKEDTYNSIREKVMELIDNEKQLHLITVQGVYGPDINYDYSSFLIGIK